MKPVYFPFTYVSPDLADRIRQYIGPFVVYQPVAGHAASPENAMNTVADIEVRTPVQGDEAQVIEAVRHYKNWGIARQGNLDAFKGDSGQGFYNETFVAEIRSEIKGKHTGPYEPDPLFSARLFLSLAQEFDMQLAELDADLAASDQRRKRLFADLKGDADTRLPLSERHAPQDLGEYQTESRIMSWLRLAAEDRAAPPVLITTSRAVFDHLIEFIPKSIVHQIFDPLPGDASFQSELRRYWAELAESLQPTEVLPPAPEADFTNDAGMRLTVAVVPVNTPADCLDLLIAPDSEMPPEFSQKGQMVVNFLEIKKKTVS